MIRCVAIYLVVFWLSVTIVKKCDAQSISSRTTRDEVDTAVEQGVSFLLTQQKKSGAIVDRGHDNAMTAIAMMALASVGHQPVDPTPEGEAMRNGLRFLLNGDRQDKSGYFGASDGSRMYGHGIVTLMLTEMLGMGVEDSMDTILHDRCQQAVDVIVRMPRVAGDTHLTPQTAIYPSRFGKSWRFEAPRTMAWMYPRQRLITQLSTWFDPLLPLSVPTENQPSARMDFLTRRITITLRSR